MLKITNYMWSLGPQYVTHDYFMPLIYCEWHLPLMEDPEAHHLQIRVGGFNPTPLKNMTSSVGMMKFPIWWESHSKFHGSSYHQPVIPLSIPLLIPLLIPSLPIYISTISESCPKLLPLFYENDQLIKIPKSSFSQGSIRPTTDSTSGEPVNRKKKCRRLESMWHKYAMSMTCYLSYIRHLRVC